MAWGMGRPDYDPRYSTFLLCHFRDKLLKALSFSFLCWRIVAIPHSTLFMMSGKKQHDKCMSLEGVSPCPFQLSPEFKQLCQRETQGSLARPCSKDSYYLAAFSSLFWRLWSIIFSCFMTLSFILNFHIHFRISFFYPEKLFYLDKLRKAGVCYVNLLITFYTKARQMNKLFLTGMRGWLSV